MQEEELEKRQEALLSALQVLTSRAHTLSYISDVQKRVNQLCDQIGLGRYVKILIITIIISLIYTYHNNKWKYNN